MPYLSGLRIADVIGQAKQIVVRAEVITDRVSCPLCGASTERVHSSYARRASASANRRPSARAARASRGAAGSESLLQALRSAPASVRFVCGQARPHGAELVIEPLSVVMETDGRRSCIQPWVDEQQAAAASTRPAGVTANAAARVDPLHDYFDELLDCLAERWLVGPAASTQAWTQLSTLGSSLGLTRLAALSGLDDPGRVLELTVATDFAYREFARLDG